MILDLTIGQSVKRRRVVDMDIDEMRDRVVKLEGERSSALAEKKVLVKERKKLKKACKELNVDPGDIKSEILRLRKKRDKLVSGVEKKLEELEDVAKDGS